MRREGGEGRREKEIKVKRIREQTSLTKRRGEMKRVSVVLLLLLVSLVSSTKSMFFQIHNLQTLLCSLSHLYICYVQEPILFYHHNTSYLSCCYILCVVIRAP